MTAAMRERSLTTATGAFAAHVGASNAAATRFFTEHADLVARACHAMSARFGRGGRLLAAGAGARRSDVAHVVVEFVHPVIVGKRALPAIALAVPDTLGALGALGALGRDADVLMLFCDGAPSAGERALLKQGRDRDMLVLSLTGVSGPLSMADFHFAVPSDDALVVQETHEILYHVLWELVHVFLGRRREGA